MEWIVALVAVMVVPFWIVLWWKSFARRPHDHLRRSGRYDLLPEIGTAGPASASTTATANVLGRWKITVSFHELLSACANLLLGAHTWMSSEKGTTWPMRRRGLRPRSTADR
jgi:hypothetical protein